MISAALGYDSERYSDAMVGVYGVLGLNMWQAVIPCIGINYNDELRAFCGADIGVFELLNLSLESVFKKDDCTVNCGLKWIFEQKVTFEFDIQNIFDDNPVRVLKFSYTEYI